MGLLSCIGVLTLRRIGEKPISVMSSKYYLVLVKKDCGRREGNVIPVCATAEEVNKIHIGKTWTSNTFARGESG